MTYLDFFELFLFGSFLVQLFYLFFFNSRLLISDSILFEQANPNNIKDKIVKNKYLFNFEFFI